MSVALVREVVSGPVRSGYASRMEALVKAAAKENGKAAADAAKILRAGLKAVASDIGKTPTDQWTFAALGKVKAGLNDTLAAATGKLKDEMKAGLERFADLGSESVTAPVGSNFQARLGGRFPSVSSDVVNVLKGFGADLITAMERDAQDAIAREVALGILAGRSQTDVMSRIEGYLGGNPSVFGSLETRAEVIYRTETLRAFSLAQVTRGNQISRTFPGTEKEWVARLDDRVRDDHAEVDGQRVPYEDYFQVGATQLFMPRDPGGKGDAKDVAAETINCRCGMVLHVPEGADPQDVAQPSAASDLAPEKRDVNDLADRVL